MIKFTRETQAVINSLKLLIQNIEGGVFNISHYSKSKNFGNGGDTTFTVRVVPTYEALKGEISYIEDNNAENHNT